MKKQLVLSLLISTCIASSFVWAKDSKQSKSNNHNHAQTQKEEKKSLNSHLNPENIEDLSIHPKWIKKAHQDPRQRLKMHKVTWRGKKWRYLVEYPRDIQHIDPQRFEEILNTAGRHGWNLVDITHENHFYAFFFKRERQHHEAKQHRERLKAYKQDRAIKRAKKLKQIHEAHQVRQKRLNEIKEIENEIKKTDELLHEELSTEHQLLKSQKKLADEIHNNNQSNK